jgi:hypothetical protein
MMDASLPIKLTKTLVAYSSFDGVAVMPSLLNPESSGEALVVYKEMQVFPGLQFESGCEISKDGRLASLIQDDVKASLTGFVNFETGAFKLGVDVKGQIGFASGDMSVGVNWLTLDIELSPAAESGIGGSISYSMAGKGSVTVPGITNLNISVSGDIFPKVMEMRASFDGSVFDTQASLTFAASKERS